MSDIAINPVTRRVQFTGNTGTGPYAFTFNVLQSSDIVVYKNNVLLTLTTDYTVSISADGTGSVTTVAALVSTDVLTIIGGRELSRTTDFVTAGDLLASSLNEQLDSNLIMSQQLDERFDRTIKADPGDVDASLNLPVKADRANKYLFFDAGGGVTTADSTSGQTGACILLDEYNYSQSDPSIDRIKLENFNNSAYHSYKIVIDSLESASSGYLFVQLGLELAGSISYVNSGYMYASDYRNVTSLNALASNTIHDNDHHSIQFQNGPIDGFTSGEFSLHQGVSGVNRRPFFTGNSMTIDKISSDAYDINHVWGARNFGQTSEIAGVQFYFSLTNISSPILIGGGSARLYGFTKA